MDFKTFFGTDRKNIKQNCIICQSYDLSLFSNEVSNGLFVKSANTDNATIIALKNNFLAGDAVLFLKNTNCKKPSLRTPSTPWKVTLGRGISVSSATSLSGQSS